ncbi:MAG: hypothetical protein OFPI_23530 [Osedax symbiont Rs2]|nr:MAG: hypothetical protein OFPI_23530 [Osedax symbiont Rs2]
MDVDNTSKQEVQFNEVPVEFSGRGGEFFGIWIVNVLLSIVTLGIYSAWATVRTKSYFYANTKLDSHAFSYLAKPLQILKGRLLAIAFVVIYSLVSNFFPLAGLFFSIALIFIFPWIIVQGLRFDSRMTSYRNVRFNFHGTYGAAFVTFILLPIVGVLSVYLAMPWVMKKMNEFVLSNTSYGEQRLTTYIETKQYYLTALLVLLVTVIGVAAIFAIVYAALGGLGLAAFAGISTAAQIAGGLVYFALIFLVNAIFKVKIRNHVFNSTEFEDLAKFRSNMAILSYFSLIATNFLAIIFSLGFAYPWTAIRTARYLAKSTQAKISDKASAVIDTMGDHNSSFGDEAADAFDVGVSVI